ncbi:hydrogenase nickel incorporation protein HypA [Candidatus Izimaplasma bacterium HR1]|jgi:hydrogenase nickel incorporation protein HypA/HybF|uniref:hydrogenase maturation nickel metallochaperone HypA/HybF n=1 Tax=Candidatus Izimoplasma sp. HR1 TaxID=1541959 RepID=UPI0004F86142|nr:hydrogenase nickel incorporation protein HypA [Candidatus Izimaplasma bacterium HR1]
MHELGIVLEIVKQVEEYKISNSIEDIEALVLQIGELSGVVPRYIEDVYPMAIENTSLSKTKLIIQIEPGIGKCKECGLSFNLVQNDNICPLCGHTKWDILMGTELLIKEIHAKE